MQSTITKPSFFSFCAFQSSFVFLSVRLFVSYIFSLMFIISIFCDLCFVESILVFVFLVSVCLHNVLFCISRFSEHPHLFFYSCHACGFFFLFGMVLFFPRILFVCRLMIMLVSAFAPPTTSTPP